MHKILIVDDEADIRELLSDLLEEQGFVTVQSSNAKNAIDTFAAEQPEIVILDIWLEGSDFDGIGVLKSIKEKNSNVPVIMISGHGNIETAIQTIKIGAYDFIEKPFNEEKLLLVLNRALQHNALVKENSHLKDINKITDKLIGSSKTIAALNDKIVNIAKSDTRVMILGESGVGKETAARCVHVNSKRRKQPFYNFCCSSLVDDDFEKVFFGDGDKKNFSFGIFEKVSSGTLYLDEITDIPLISQAKLLKVIQDQYFIKPRSGVKVNVECRVISSTTKDIEALIQKDEFNKSLFYRLNVVPLNMAPLREHREDIKELCEYIVSTNKNIQNSGLRINKEVLTALEMHEWPGNIRELINVIEWLAIMFPNKDVAVKDLPIFINKPANNNAEAGILQLANIAKLNLKGARDEFEKVYLKAQLNRFNGNVSKTADEIGMDRTALHRKIKSLNIA